MADFNPKWWQAQNTDPLYLQQVADVFSQLPGDEAAFKNPALRAITQQGAIGNDPSGFLALLNEAFKSRGITSPFSSKELSDSAVAAQALNQGELSDYGQIQRRLSDRNRTETNDLAARGILQSGENTYRAGERNLLGNQLNYSSFQGLLDRIEGLSAGKLAAEQAHKQNLWKYLESATTRMSAAEAARRAQDAADAAAAAGRRDVTKGSGDPTQGEPVYKPPGVPSGVGPWPDAPGSNTGEFNPTPPPYKPPEFNPTPPISSSQGKRAGSLGVPIGVPYTPYKPPAPPKPKPLPKVSGAFTSPAFATKKYRSLAGIV